MQNNQYKRWMVALDLTSFDSKVISWVNYLASIFKPETVYFIHVERNLEMPEYLPPELKESFQAADEGQKAIIQKMISEDFEEASTNVQIEVIEGKPVDSLLHWAKVKKVDFFIAGNKARKKGKGILPHKLSRRLSCPMLFVPDREITEVKSVLVPIDFSEYSSLALEAAAEISKKANNAKVTCFHAYDVPVGYYRTGKTYEEFAEIMRVNAEEEFKKLRKSYDLQIEFKSSPLDKKSTSELILDEIKANKYDIVVLGSKGQSIGSLILLGSTTEKFIQINKSCLTWVVKKSGENVNFFTAIGKI